MRSSYLGSSYLDGLERRTTGWMARHGIALLRVSMGTVFFWFGALKFFPTFSPAHELAGRTIAALSFGLVDPALSLPLLAAWECLIGLGLISGRFLRPTLVLLFLHMSGTMLPFFLFPGQLFTRFPYATTLEGQYILKNLVLVSAAVVIGATVRGGALVADPKPERDPPVTLSRSSLRSANDGEDEADSAAL
jgi:uncharacterized membrane protein YphA (DoxX/SURF4 family)